MADYLAVTGLWALASPHGERDANGLLVYHRLQPDTPSDDVLAEANTKLTSIEPAIAVMTQVPMRQLIGNERWNASVARLNTCTRTLATQRFEAAVIECTRAIQIWGDNHLAWYGLAAAHLAKGEWDQAVYPARQAIALRPDVAMYQLYYGIAVYRMLRERAAARPDPFHVRLIDPATFQRDSARDAFRRAVKLMPGLWRAHYYLASMELEDGDAALAARQLDQAIVTNPDYAQSYLALVELYLRWGYRDEARAVAVAGTQRMAPHDAFALWYELGTIYQADGALPEAVEAFTRVIEVEPNHVLARFHRGEIYVEIGKHMEARDDLGIAAGARDPAFEVEKKLAGQLLWNLGKLR
jgi:tetratricopeptide (TPR) repeat protein